MPNGPVTSYSDDPVVDGIVSDIITRVSEKWTFITIEVLEEKSPRRFSEIERELPGISQKMLSKTLQQMEREGLVERTVYAQVPPRVEYALTQLGSDLAEAFCPVWQWAEKNRAAIEAARAAFDGDE